MPLILTSHTIAAVAHPEPVSNRLHLARLYPDGRNMNGVKSEVSYHEIKL